MSVCPFCLSIRMSVCLSVPPYVCPSICLSLRMSVPPYVCPSTSLSVCVCYSFCACELLFLCVWVTLSVRVCYSFCACVLLFLCVCVLPFLCVCVLPFLCICVLPFLCVCVLPFLWVSFSVCACVCVHACFVCTYGAHACRNCHSSLITYINTQSILPILTQSIWETLVVSTYHWYNTSVVRQIGFNSPTFRWCNI